MIKDFRKEMKRGDFNFGHLRCNIGLVMSVQASEYSYSYPRENFDDAEMYSEFEIGFPSLPLHSIKKYAEDKDDLTNTVYGYVPYIEIQKVIDDNGGLLVKGS